MSDLNNDKAKVLTDIATIIKSSSLDEQFYELVLKRLESFGYTIKAEDGFVISFAIQTVDNHIRSECNTSSIPNELENIAIDKICGEFLYNMKQCGKLTDFNFETAIAQIQTGDTSMTFVAGMAPEQKFDSLLKFLMLKGEGDFICYRKLKW